MTICDFPIIAKEVEIFWDANNEVGDALVKIKKGETIIELPPMQALAVLGQMATAIVEAHDFNRKHDCEDHPRETK